MLNEVCVGNISDAIEMEKRGADRIELCDNLLEGGTTPSIGTIEIAKEILKIPFNVIIRPRGGDFVFSSVEKEVMKKDIVKCREIGVNGVVIGAITSEGEVDVEFVKEVMGLKGDLQITFHMAFDFVKDKFNAIDLLVRLGVDRILTRGGEKSAIDNKETIKEYINYAGNRIIIMPGGGINKDNKDVFGKFLGAKELHGTKLV